MAWNYVFFINSVLLGAGLAMDAFSVCIANAVAEPGMSRMRQVAMSGVYAFFQFVMPLVGWFCVRTVASIFSAFQKCIPWIALALLAYIGIKMIVQSVAEGKACRGCTKKQEECAECKERPGQQRLSLAVLLVQGVATSIDALSAGFTIAEYGLLMATVSCLIIAAVTFSLCFAGLKLGRVAGKSLSFKAQIVGGIILVCIGLEIFVRGIF